MTLVRGGTSPVVDDADVAELMRRKSNCEVIVVDGAGHSVQGDRPVELATSLTRILAA
jgi:pimeloyl-ACP methyl ester carboxylesterase